MKNYENNFLKSDNYFPINQYESPDLIINNQPDNFVEEEDIVFIAGQNEDTNKKSHSCSIKTNATYGEMEQNENEVFSFSFNKEAKIKKELTKESEEILNNFIQKENNLILLNNKKINMNLNYENSIKDIKCNLVNINEKIYTYFKRPYMRKNYKKSKNIFDIKKLFDEDEKIKFDEKNIEDLKDDDTKTNNDSFEDECNLLDKKKFK
jgi:hypothetical protein